MLSPWYSWRKVTPLKLNNNNNELSLGPGIYSSLKLLGLMENNQDLIRMILVSIKKSTWPADQIMQFDCLSLYCFQWCERSWGVSFQDVLFMLIRNQGIHHWLEDTVNDWILNCTWIIIAWLHAFFNPSDPKVMLPIIVTLHPFVNFYISIPETWYEYSLDSPLQGLCFLYWSENEHGPQGQ